MADAAITFQRLLERGFYPRELPPTFRTIKFGETVAAKKNILKPQKDFSGETIFLDGATFQGNHRTFGVINPINYCLLSEFIANNWDEIEKVMNLSAFSAFKVSFPKSLAAQGRSFTKVAFSQKKKKKAVLSSAYPCVVFLDINRFYGSIYSHSISWAALGKQAALEKYANNILDDHWSTMFDKLVRACNRNQTIGIPIGPDTSRVVSEFILSRIDHELANSGPKIKPKQALHNIDDYEFGVMDQSEAEATIARFEKEIRQFELRSHQDKKKIIFGGSPENQNWELKFHLLTELKEKDFLNGLFGVIASERTASPNSNVVGYALGRFAKKIAECKDKNLALEHLQRLLFSKPGYVAWVGPHLVGLKGTDKLDSAQKRLLRWGVDECARRHDTVSLLWFLYLHIKFDLKISKVRVKLCYEVESPLVDLTIAHAKQNNLTKCSFKPFVERYKGEKLHGASWLYLYETETQGWSFAFKGKKIGSFSVDPSNFYKFVAGKGVHFYDIDAFGVEVFDWRLTTNDFDNQEVDDALRVENSDFDDTDEYEDEGDVFSIY